MKYWCTLQHAAAAKSLQSCPPLCDPRDGSPPGSPVPGILQARTLEWGAISFSNAWKWKVKVKSLSNVRLLATPWPAAYQAPPSWDFPGKSTGVGCHCLLRCNFLRVYNYLKTLLALCIMGDISPQSGRSPLLALCLMNTIICQLSHLFKHIVPAMDWTFLLPPKFLCQNLIPIWWYIRF